MDSFNFQKETIVKTSPLNSHSFAYIQDKKKEYVFIAAAKEISLFNVSSAKIQDKIKVNSQDGEISCICVSDDLAFYAYGMNIGAVGTNCKKVFDFNTNIAAEKIERIHVIGYNLWVFSGSILNEFLMGGSQLSNKLSRKGACGMRTEDAHSHMFESKVNDSFAVEDEFSKHYLIVLKSNNQIVCFENKQLASLKTSSPPLTIMKYPKSKADRFLVGLSSGEIMQIEVSKKHIQEIWMIKQGSKGRINCLIEAKNESFFVFKDSFVEAWGQDRTLLGSEETGEKSVGGLYLDDKQLLISGTAEGNVTLMRDYLKTMKEYDKKNHSKAKQNLQKDISSLKSQLQSLKAKAASQKTKAPIMNQGIVAETSLTIDYGLLCNCLQIKSDSSITKIILKGNLEIVKCSKMVFSGKEEASGENMFMVEEEGGKDIRIWIKSAEKYQKQNKLKLMVYGDRNGKTYGVTRSLDCKVLSLHHKIQTTELPHANILSIEGQIKYFQLNMYLNMIFNDFGPSSENGDVFSPSSFESVITKQKVTVKYKNNECQIRAMDPSILVSIKQFLVQKCRQKHLSLNYSTQLSSESIAKLVTELAEIIKPIEQLKIEYELLPGLFEIRNDDNLSANIKSILARSEQIKVEYEDSKSQYEFLINQLKQCYICYQKLKDQQVSPYELDSFTRLLGKFEKEKIVAAILS